MSDEVLLKAVFAHQWHNLSSTNEYGDCKLIVIKKDGHGLSGYYDRVHILKEDGDYIIVPAHNCEMMYLLEAPQESE